MGTSNFGPRQLRLANAYWAERGVPHTANQVQFSLLSTLPLESGLFEACAELGVTPIGSNPDPDPDPNSNPHPHPHPHPSPSPNPNPGVTPIGYSPLALGLLSDRYDESRLPKGPRGLP